jgi:hypothetical protein
MSAFTTPNGFNIDDSGARVVVDPVTRIEGHMRCEVNIDEENIIRNAVSTGTMWRGLEVILKGRDPRDAWAFTQRICGVCTGTHALTSVRAVEDALRHRNSRKRQFHPQHHAALPAGPRPSGAFLPSACARLGEPGQRAAGRSACHLAPATARFAEPCTVLTWLFPRHAEPSARLCGIRAARPLPQRLLDATRPTSFPPKPISWR